MYRCAFRLIAVGAVVMLLMGRDALGRQKLDEGRDPGGGEQIALATPAYGQAAHRVGNIVLSVTNYGVFAAQDDAVKSNQDVFTGFTIQACEFPKRSGTQYSYAGAFWIGAVVGRDTLVSVGADGWQRTGEMFPDAEPFGNLQRRSIIDPNSPEYEGAISEQDFIATYTDTYTCCVAGLGNDFIEGRPHRPLHVEVTQRSFAWSYPYAEDFILFDYSIRNIGVDRLKNVYMGIYVDADVKASGADTGFDDDVCGFRETQPTVMGSCECEYLDTVNIAWIADNDGELSGGGLFSVPLPSVTATRIVRTPSDSLDVSFNWWVSNGNPALDFGPMTKNKYRDFQTGGTGTPEGDRNKYFVLKNREFDYDQVYTMSIGPRDSTWLYPPQTIAAAVTPGYDTRYLLSFGPFTIDPGQTLPISFAYTGGANFHTNPNNLDDNIIHNYNPDEYYRNLNFSDLAVNARWASWIYDNPGVDTDGDGYFGKFRICCCPTTGVCDTIFYEGDGVPDFRGASPPPAPIMRIEPRTGELIVRFNGFRSETTRDVFSREFDFEGYRVYFGRDDREQSYSLVSSYDIEDFNKFIYLPDRREWTLRDAPYTLVELDSLYGSLPDTIDFDPLRYTAASPLVIPGDPDSLFYFEAQDFNRSIAGVNTLIGKRFPDAPNPLDAGYSDPDSVPADLRDEFLTDDGYFKFYDYELTLSNLLPTVPYYVNVTAFDFGSRAPEASLPSLESSKTVNPEVAYALDSYAEAQDANQGVYVWPNPYRGDADYLASGFEGRFSRFDPPIQDRERRIHFANLPPKCTIKIFSIDGDLVREIQHDVDPADPTAMHDEWDLITRNTQMVVSGIYYWTVESPDGETQIGKLVIIL